MSLLNFFSRNAPTVSTDRWVVLDLETSGLDPAQDRIIEIGAVALHRGEIVLHDYFHRVLSGSGEVSAANRVVHGVTALEQYDGAALSDAIDALLHWIGPSPLVGFFVEFDIKFLRAAINGQANRAAAKAFAQHALDVQKIAPVVFNNASAKKLAEWSAELALPITKQHRALTDALATAHLLQRIVAKLPAEQRSFEQLKTLESAQRWL